jgi:sensor histidine kinase YesM
MIIEKYQTTSIKQLVKEFSLVVIFNTAIAILLWMMMPGKDSFLMFFLRSQSIGLSIFTVIHIFFLSLKPSNSITQAILLIICIILGSIIGVSIFDFFFDAELKNYFYTVFTIGLFFGIIISYFFITHEKYSQLKIEIQEEELKSISLEKENIQANLKLLQAQIEPHFLFNTLSNVLSLLDTDITTGKKMLENLTQYLRTSLKHTRNEINSLKQEIETIQAYLDINKIRMGDRLNFKIDIPEDLYKISFPPMLIQPLVENAIKHGIEPKVAGGMVSINITGKKEILKIEIADTGLGINSELSSKIGIDNVKKRIKALYGNKGHIIFEDNKPSGLKVTIEVPYEKDNSNNC